MIDMTREEIGQMFAESLIGRLCMADTDGTPYSIPLPFCWLDTSPARTSACRIFARYPEGILVRSAICGLVRGVAGERARHVMALKEYSAACEIISNSEFWINRS
jgi:hypothetical protein